MARLAWDEREQPLLEAIKELEDDTAGGLENGHIGEASQLSDGDVALGLQALLDGGFITGDVVDSLDGGSGVYLLNTRLSPPGRVKVRQWHGDDAAAAFLASLDEAFERSDDPEERKSIDRVRQGARGLAGKVITEIAVAYGKRIARLEG